MRLQPTALIAQLTTLPLLAAAAGSAPRAPPMGWSSWYAYGGGVTQQQMEAGYRAMADRSRGGVSLLDVGYVHAKLDDGWQACHSGFNGSSFHGPDGRPLVNKTKFPNITAMTAVAASLGLKPAMYYNNYICHESMPPGGVDGSRYKQMLQGSVDFLFDQGFDGVKIDSGGPFNNMEEWHVAFEETRKRLRPEGEPLFVENCHQGGQEPNASWCPFDIFRTAGDPGVVGWEVEMIQTAAVLNRSYDGCWAYPGYASYAQAIATDANVTGSKGYNDSKTQFSVHSVASSPLVLSFDLNVNNKSHGRSLDTVWSIITNRAAIKINQQWEGSPGALLRLWSPHNPAFPLYAWNAPCDDTSSDPDSAQAGWSHAADGTVRWSGSSDDDATTVQCIVGSKWHHAAIMAPCNASDWQQVFVADADGRLWQKAAPSSAAAARRNQPLNVLNASVTSGAGTSMTKCNGKPSQTWHASVNGSVTNVQGAVTTHDGCWEITGCSSATGAHIGIGYGCKNLPSPPTPASCAGSSKKCQCNGAWQVVKKSSSAASTYTISTIMDGHCLRVDGTNVDAALCDATSSSQKWTVTPSASHATDGTYTFSIDGQCVDSHVKAPPVGTDGLCLAVTSRVPNTPGPGLQLTTKCDANKSPAPPSQTFVFDTTSASHHLTVGNSGKCVAALHGQPTPFGPMQLWSKPQPNGSAAVLWINRGDGSADVHAPPQSTVVSLGDHPASLIPGLKWIEGAAMTLTDVWTGATSETTELETLSFDVWPGDALYLLIEPAKTKMESVDTIIVRPGEMSLHDARDLARKTGAKRIELRAGRHELASPLHLTAADSGVAWVGDVTTARSGPTTTISGGRAVTGWAACGGSAPTSVMCATLTFANASALAQPRQLFINNRRAPRGVTSSKVLGAFLNAANVDVNAYYVDGELSGAASWADENAGSVEFVYTAQGSPWTESRCTVENVTKSTLPLTAAAALKAGAAQQCAADYGTTKPCCGQPGSPVGPSYVCTAAQPKCVGYVYDHHYGTCRGGAPVPPADTIVYMKQPCFAALQAKPCGQSTHTPAHIENAAMSDLIAGQWFLDRSGSKPRVAYFPLPGEDVTKATVIMPVLEHLVASEKSTTGGALPLRDAKFSGLTFEHATWSRPNTGLGYIEQQSGALVSTPGTACIDYEWEPMPSNIALSGSVGATFDQCTFQHLGGGALQFDSGAHNNTVSRCTFTDVSGTAVQIGRYDTYNITDASQQERFNTVSDCVIDNVATEYHGNAGLSVGYSYGTSLLHNVLTNLSYSGISIGWGWSREKDTYAAFNTVAGNEINGFKLQRSYPSASLGDGGGIYALGPQQVGLSSS